MQDDTAFQSQQFTEQVAQRRDRYSAQKMDLWGQAGQLPAQFQMARAQQQQMEQNQQAHQLDMARGAQQLSLDEMRRQQAVQELQWARELHTTDILEAQKRGAMAQANLAEAQAKKAMADMEGQDADRWMRLRPEQQMALRARGIDFTFSGGKIVPKDVEETDRKAAEDSYQGYVQSLTSRNERTRQSLNPDVERKRLMNELDQVQEDILFIREPEEKAAAEEHATWLRNRIRSMGVGSISPGAPTEPPKPKEKTLAEDLAESLSIFNSMGGGK